MSRKAKKVDSESWYFLQTPDAKSIQSEFIVNNAQKRDGPMEETVMYPARLYASIYTVNRLYYSMRNLLVSLINLAWQICELLPLDGAQPFACIRNIILCWIPQFLQVSLVDSDFERCEEAILIIDNTATTAV